MAYDSSLGFIVTEWLQVPLTESLFLHSHLQQMKTIPLADLTKQAILFNLIPIFHLGACVC